MTQIQWNWTIIGSNQPLDAASMIEMIRPFFAEVVQPNRKGCRCLIEVLSRESGRINFQLRNSVPRGSSGLISNFYIETRSLQICEDTDPPKRIGS